MFRYSFSLAVLLLCCSLSAAEFFPDYDDDSPLPMGHERIRRFVRFMSRKPGPDAVPEMGIGFRGHLMNLLKGGKIGMEFQIPHVDRFGKSFPNSWKEWLDDKGKKDEEKVLEIENRHEENEIDYQPFINPRVKKEEP